MKYEIIEKQNGEISNHIMCIRSVNEMQILAEDLECIEMWLNNKNAPTHDKDGNKYSHIGRIEQLLNVC